MSRVERMGGRSATAFVKMNTRVLALLCLEALLVAIATGASVGGSVSLDKNSFATSGEIVFPKIPGFNSPLPTLADIIKLLSGQKSTNNSTDSSSNVSDKPSNDSNSAENPTANNSTDSGEQTADNSANSNNQTAGNSTSNDNQTESNSTSINTPNDDSQTNDNSGSDETEKKKRDSRAANESTAANSQSTDGKLKSSPILGLPKIPNVLDLIPNITALTDPANTLIPRISDLPSLSDLANSPELAAALEKARNETAAALGFGSDLVSGIQKAIEQAIKSINPTEVLRNVVDTILNVYQAVASNCPLLVVGTRVLGEGIRLAFEVAKSVQNVITG